MSRAVYVYLHSTVDTPGPDHGRALSSGYVHELHDDAAAALVARGVADYRDAAPAPVADAPDAPAAE